MSCDHRRHTTGAACPASPLAPAARYTFENNNITNERNCSPLKLFKPQYCSWVWRKLAKIHRKSIYPDRIARYKTICTANNKQSTAPMDKNVCNVKLERRKRATGTTHIHTGPLLPPHRYHHQHHRHRSNNDWGCADASVQITSLCLFHFRSIFRAKGFYFPANRAKTTLITLCDARYGGAGGFNVQVK